MWQAIYNWGATYIIFRAKSGLEVLKTAFLSHFLYVMGMWLKSGLRAIKERMKRAWNVKNSVKNGIAHDIAHELPMNN